MPEAVEVVPPKTELFKTAAVRVLLVRVCVPLSVTSPVAVSVGVALITAAPEPKPSVTTMTLEPLEILIVAPEPCLIVMIWLPVVEFSISHTLEIVLGPSVTSRVAVREAAEVIFK